MLHCKHCGHFSTEDQFPTDQWGYIICPKCGGEDLINLEEEQCKVETYLNAELATVSYTKKTLNTIADIADNLPTIKNGHHS